MIFVFLIGLFYRSLVGLFLYVYVAFDSFGAAQHIKSSVSFIGFFYESLLQVFLTGSFSICVYCFWHFWRSSVHGKRSLIYRSLLQVSHTATHIYRTWAPFQSHHHCNTHCSTLQHTATHCNTHLSYLSAFSITSSLQHALQHTATHGNTRDNTHLSHLNASAQGRHSASICAGGCIKNLSKSQHFKSAPKVSVKSQRQKAALKVSTFLATKKRFSAFL